MAKNWFSKIDEMSGFVKFDTDPFESGIFSSSPSVNFIFGNTHLLPFGYAAIFWGGEKSGKGVMISDMIGQLHKSDPTAIALKFNTEFRERVQMNERIAKEFGIDLTRYRARDTNTPEDIFDFIEIEVPKMCQAGANIRLIAIDSVSDILGRRMINATTVNTQQMGDHAATVQDGLKRIRRIVREYNIALIMTAHARAEMDPVEQMRGKKIKMEGAHYLKHFAEYFVYLERDLTKDARADIFGKSYEDESLTDLKDHAEVLAHKVKVVMKASSVGIEGRTGEFTLHKYKGIINQWEEIFKLGIARGVIARPNLRSYILHNYPAAIQELKWGSFDDAAIGIRDNEDVQKEILRRIKLHDIDLHQKGIVQDIPLPPEVQPD